MSPTCGDNGGVTKAGNPCGSTIIDESGLCQSHRPTNEAVVLENLPVLPGDEVDADRVAELEALLAEEREARITAEEQAVAERARAEKFDPTRDVTDRIFGDTGDVSNYFSPEHIREVAEAELADLNRNRMRRGYSPVDWDEATWAKKIEETKQAMVAERHGLVPTAGPLTRVMKLYNPKGNSLVQIPMEDQVNNHRGSLADSVERYRAKGFKLARVRCRIERGELVPERDGPIVTLFCGAINCWEPAAAEAGGKFLNAGYCGPDHQRRTEAGKEKADGSTNPLVMAGV